MNSIEDLEKFINLDMTVKEDLYNLKPNDMDGYNDYTVMSYADRLWKNTEDIQMKFENMLKCFNYPLFSKDRVMKFFENLKEQVLNAEGDINKLSQVYMKKFTSMDSKLNTEAYENLCGRLVEEIKDLKFVELLGKCTSVNELLHVMHTYTTNNERFMEVLPKLAEKKNYEGYPLTLYGRENAKARELFEKIPETIQFDDSMIVSTRDKIIVQMGGKGHALAIEIENSDDQNFVRYFIPKICNVEMIKKVKGVNFNSNEFLSAVSGNFMVSNDTFSKEIIDFIESVPMDKDMPRNNFYVKPNNEINQTAHIQNEETLFTNENIKNMTKNRGIGAIKKVFNLLRTKIIGEREGERDEENTRDK